MVAGANRYFSCPSGCIIDFWRQQCCCTIYLFFILMRWQPKHSSLTVIAIGFGLLFYFLHKQWMLVPVGAALLGFVIKPVGDYVHLLWMMIAKVLGWINSRVLLSIIFFLVLTPVAIVARLFGKSAFVKPSGSAKTIFLARNHLYTKQDLQNTW